ncbi:MAG: hypothetical protein AAGF79_08295 [Pseudomonadota bacterium]
MTLAEASVHSAGAWPFTTFRSYMQRGRPIIWRARHHRKGLARTDRALEATPPPVWHTKAYNWWNGLAFLIGAALFILGSALSLIPGAAETFTQSGINSLFFAGSIPFTIAGYMQHFQAANAGGFDAGAAARTRVSLIGWHPASPGWLSTFCQFVGTVAFNFNTFDALVPPQGVGAQNLAIWLPGMIGSVLFLISAYLAFVETAHAYWTWRASDLAWWIVFINLLGCVFFLAASILYWVPRGPEPAWVLPVANGALGLGALGFFAGAALMMREARAEGVNPKQD